MQYCIAEILSNVEIAHNVYKLIIQKRDNEIWKPGNFLMVLPEPAPPFFSWRKAFSVYSQTEYQLEMVIKKVGKVTEILEKSKAGTQVSYLGPMGNSFNTNRIHDEETILVAGGIGIAPLHLLAQFFITQGIAFTLLYGATTSSEIIKFSDLNSASSAIIYATEDGSKGYKGKVTDVLSEYLAKSSGRKHIYACGPFAMLNALHSHFNDPALTIEVSIESVMACGFGVCRGCAIPVAGNAYKMACTDGPVFTLDEIIWEKWQ